MTLLDTRTLTFVDVIAAAAICLAMIFIWRTRKTYPGFGLWTLANLVGVLGYSLLLLRGIVPDLFSVILANLMVLFSHVLYFEGARRFHGRSSVHRVSLIVTVVMLVTFVYFTTVINVVSLRVVIASLLLGIVCILCANELYRGATRSQGFTHWFTGSMFLFYGLTMLARAVLIFFTPAMQDYFEPSMFIAISTYLIPMPLGIAWTFGLVTLNNERLENELVAIQQEIHLLAITDSLTGVYNHRYFFELGKNEALQARRYRDPLAVLSFDIDNFKQINDVYGHPVGDKVLLAVVATCHKSLRVSDILGRLGGDEFGVILPKTDLEDGKITAERLRVMIAAMEVEADTALVHVTLSIGLSMVTPGEDGVEPALNRADQALYQVKRSGRNQVLARVGS